jgi:hypothetical protein
VRADGGFDANDDARREGIDFALDVMAQWLFDRRA